MTPQDDRWIDLTACDGPLDDGIWEGTVPPEQLPDWAANLTDLLHQAQGPATDEELAAQWAIVDEMRMAVRGSRRPRPGANAARSRGSLLRRVVAAKTIAAVALVALGVAAAEATTGVVSAVLPDRSPETQHPVDSGPDDPPTTEQEPGGDQAPSDTASDARDDTRPPGANTHAGPDDTDAPPGPSDSSSKPDQPSADPDRPGHAGDPPGHAGDPPGQQGKPPHNPQSHPQSDPQAEVG